MIDLTDIELDLHDARDHAANLRHVLHAARCRDISLPSVAATLAITERQIDRLTATGRAMRAACDRLCGIITGRARQGLPHGREEARLLRMLGCEELDGDRWPYVVAALRAHEEPTAETMTAFFTTRQVMWNQARRAA